MNPRGPERPQANWCLFSAGISRLAPCLARRPRLFVFYSGLYLFLLVKGNLKVYKSFIFCLFLFGCVFCLAVSSLMMGKIIYMCLTNSNLLSAKSRRLNEITNYLQGNKKIASAEVRLTISDECLLICINTRSICSTG